MPKGRALDQQKLAVAILVPVVVLAGLWIAWEVALRPRTIGEVLNATNVRPGTSIEVEGTITRVERRTTSYGPAVVIELDGGVVCTDGEVFGDPSIDYAVGQRFRTTLRFVEVRFNGDPGVWTPGLFCPLPGLPAAIGTVIDAVAEVAGIRLAFVATDADGWTTYEMRVPDGGANSPDAIRISLRRGVSTRSGTDDPVIDSAAEWSDVMALEYVAVSGGFANHPEVDAMGSLADGASRNGTIRYVDANGNGLVDDLDRMQLRLEPTGGDGRYATYFLDLNGFLRGGSTPPAGGKYILQGPEGPYEVLS